MTRRLLASLSLLLLSSAALGADVHTATTWDEALALSRQHDRPILIDFFTEW